MRAGGTYLDEHRQVRCRVTGKLALSRRVAVQRARAARRQRRDDPVVEYPCHACDWWHIGHQPHRIHGPQPRRRPRTPRRRAW
jgi:hypothetical protein